MRIKLLTLISLMVALSSLAFGQSGAPDLLQFHGKLVNPMTGQPITTPTQLRVQVIQGGTAEENPTTGRVVFTEQARVEPNEKGEFDYVIGSNARNDSRVATLNAADLNTSRPVFVELALMAPNQPVRVLLPRQRLVSVGFALQAGDAAVDERLVHIEGDIMTGPLEVRSSLSVGSGGPSMGTGDAFVAGTLQVGASSLRLNGSGIRFPDGTTQTTAGIAPTQVVRSLNGLMGNLTLAQGANITITPSGNMLTIAAPNSLSSVAHNATLTGNGTSGMPLSVAVPLSFSAASLASTIAGTNNSSGPGVSGFNNSSGPGVFGGSESGFGVLANSESGDIIAGVSNSILRFRVTNSGQGRSNVGFTTPALDFAEMMEVDESSRPAAEAYQPGDVLIISPETGKLKKCSQPYCSLVAGIYSTNPGFLGGQGIEEKSASNKVPLALVGQVPCKVTTENGPIQIGDLLVTSSTPGYAMKGTDRSQMLGAIVGKALERLPSGTGIIRVLMTLQ